MKVAVVLRLLRFVEISNLLSALPLLGVVKINLIYQTCSINVN